MEISGTEILKVIALAIVMGALVFGMRVDRGPLFGVLWLLLVVLSFYLLHFLLAIVAIFAGLFLGGRAAIEQFRKDIEG
jgi:hypothetical protein